MYCGKCGNKAEKDQKFCSHCGASLQNIESVTEELKIEEDKLENSLTPNKKQHKINPNIIKNKVQLVKAFILKNRRAVAIISVFAVVLCFALVFVFGNGNSKKEMASIYRELHQVSDNIEVMADDVYNAWHYGIYEDYQTVSGLSDEVSVAYEDLDNDYCSLILFADDFNYSINCVRQAHEDLGDYTNAQKKLQEIKNKIAAIKENGRNKTNLDSLKKYYGLVNDYYELAYDYGGSFNQLADDLSDIKSEIKSVSSILELELDIDFIPSDDGLNI